LVGIYAALAETSREAVLQEFGGSQFGVFKPALAELAVEKIAPITAKMNELMKDKAAIDAVLEDGAERASAIAEPVLKDVKRIIGFV